MLSVESKNEWDAIVTFLRRALNGKGRILVLNLKNQSNKILLHRFVQQPVLDFGKIQRPMEVDGQRRAHQFHQLGRWSSEKLHSTSDHRSSQFRLGITAFVHRFQSPVFHLRILNPKLNACLSKLMQ